MYAIEFITSIKNGIVHIPDRYKELQQKESVKILILVEEQGKDIKYDVNDMKKSEMSDNTDNFFDKFQIDLTDYNFSRDEANAR
jgi:hypothetical protein